MKLLISLTSLEHIYPSYGIVLGYEKYTFFASYIARKEELKNIKEKDKIYLLLNAMLHQKDVEDFKNTVKELIDLGYQNYIVQDLGMVDVLKSLKAKEIIFNPYTLVCNQQEYQTYVDYLGVTIGISNELSIEEKAQYQDNSFIQIYGFTPIYQSYRKTLSIYEESHHKKLESKDLYVKENTRDDLHHIIENDYGTVIFRSEKINLIKDIKSLNKAKYLYIESLYSSKEEIDEFIKELENE